MNSLEHDRNKTLAGVALMVDAKRRRIYHGDREPYTIHVDMLTLSEARMSQSYLESRGFVQVPSAESRLLTWCKLNGIQAWKDQAKHGEKRIVLNLDPPRRFYRPRPEHAARKEEDIIEAIRRISITSVFLGSLHTSPNVAWLDSEAWEEFRNSPQVQEALRWCPDPQMRDRFLDGLPVLWEGRWTTKDTYPGRGIAVGFDPSLAMQMEAQGYVQSIVSEAAVFRDDRTRRILRDHDEKSRFYTRLRQPTPAEVEGDSSSIVRWVHDQARRSLTGPGASPTVGA